MKKILSSTLVHWIMYACLLAAVLVFVSFYGGGLSYMLAISVVLLPFLSLIYLFAVRFFLRLYQTSSAIMITKGEDVTYRLVMDNSGIISFAYVQLIFEKGMAEIALKENKKDYSLEPGEKVIKEGRITCLYRGSYQIGVREIIIRDLFLLFTMKYTFPTPLRMVVRPKVLYLDQLAIAMEESDPKAGGSQTVGRDPGFILRKYVPSDSIHRIHWKNSARMHELMVRQNDYEEIISTIVLMDSKDYAYGDFEDIILDDRRIEAFLAILNYYVHLGKSVTAIYGTEQCVRMELKDQKTFEVLYRMLTEGRLESAHSPEELLENSITYEQGRKHIILLVHKVSRELNAKIVELLDSGNTVSVVVLEGRIGLGEIHFPDGAIVQRISLDDDMEEILCKGI